MYQKVLVPLDGSPLAECVLPHVEFLVRGGSAKEVVLARAVEPFHLQLAEPQLTEELRLEIDEKALQDAEAYLEGIARRPGFGGAKVRVEVLHEKVAEGLVDFANDNGVDLVVIATHGRSGARRWHWGGTADRILHSVNAPVLMVRVPEDEAGE